MFNTPEYLQYRIAILKEKGEGKNENLIRKLQRRLRSLTDSAH